MSGPSNEQGDDQDEDDPEDRIPFNAKVKRRTYEELNEKYPHAFNDSEILRQMAQDILEND